MTKQVNVFLIILYIQGALFANDQVQNEREIKETLDSTLAGISQKIKLGRNDEVGLIVYKDQAVFISNDYPGSGNRQVYFRDKNSIAVLKKIFQEKDLLNKTVNENFQEESSTLICINRGLKEISDSFDKHLCRGGEKADRQFEVLVDERAKEDCTAVDGKVLIENYNGDSITYTRMTYSCGKEKKRHTITCKGKWAGDLKGCLENKFTLTNWINKSEKIIFKKQKQQRELEDKINGATR